jgi:DegV family protein with EDD domain
VTVRIVTDSSACVPAPLARERGIVVVPLEVMVDGRSVPAGELGVADVVELRDRGATLSTSAPSPGAFADALDTLEPGDAAVVITVASKVSATHSSARTAASLTDRRVEVVDSGTAAGGHALVALAAAAAATDRDAGVGEVAAEATAVAGRVHLRAAVDSLEALAASGRIPKSVATMADGLKVRPLFEFRDGAAHVIVPSIGTERARRRLVDACLSPDTTATGDRLHASVLHAAEPAAADDVAATLRDARPDADLIVSEFDASMVIHSGTGLLGIAWWWE